MVVAVQPIDASRSHDGLFKVVLNIVSRVSPLSTKRLTTCRSSSSSDQH